MLETQAEGAQNKEMIPAEDHLEQKRIYSKDGYGLWRVIAYCEEPTITMENVLTKQRENFGVNGHTARSFSPIKGLKAGQGVDPIEVDP